MDGRFTRNGAGRIFQTWLSPPNRQEFETVSRRLADFFAAHLQTDNQEGRQTTLRRHMYHLLGADVAEGLRRFEQLCRLARAQLRYTKCAALITLVHDYDAIFTDAQLVTVSYHEAKLASDMRDWPTAERRFRAILDSDAADTLLRAKSNLRLGYVLAQQSRFREALAECQRRAIARQPTGPPAQSCQGFCTSSSITYRDIGEQEEASRLLLESAERAAANAEWSSFAIAQNSLGALYSETTPCATGNRGLPGSSRETRS